MNRYNGGQKNNYNNNMFGPTVFRGPSAKGAQARAAQKNQVFGQAWHGRQSVNFTGGGWRWGRLRGVREHIAKERSINAGCARQWRGKETGGKQTGGREGAN